MNAMSCLGLAIDILLAPVQRSPDADKLVEKTLGSPQSATELVNT